MRIARLYRYLCDEKHEYTLSRNLVNDGTLVGAHVKEAQHVEGPGAFVNELSLALRKASRTEYWLELLLQSGYLTEKEFASIHEDCVELLKMLTASIKTNKSKN